MELVDYLVSSGLVLLGIISILVGKYLSLKLIMPKTEKYKVVDERNYIKYSRMIFYDIGFYYTLLGIVLLFIHRWPTIVNIVNIAGPWILVLFIAGTSRNKRKYVVRINN